MQADIGGRRLMIAHLPRRHARGRLFTASGRNVVVLACVAVAVLLGLGALNDRANSTPSHRSAPFAWIGR